MRRAIPLLALLSLSDNAVLAAIAAVLLIAAFFALVMMEAERGRG